MTGSIVYFPGAEIKDETKSIDTSNDDISDPVSDEYKIKLIEKIDKFRKLVEDGRIVDIVFVATDSVTNYPITDISFSPFFERSDIFNFIGLLESIKLELSEDAAMSTVVDIDGKIVDPFESYDE